jgi:hypothetical protein
MRGAIVVVTAILGVVLVLAGTATLWAGALRRQPSEDPAGRRPEDGQSVRPGQAPSAVERGVAVAAKLPGGERLIGWGVVLLALAAVASGAITFSATVAAGTN